ncbi:MAG: hypothetical protein KDC48_23345, partial [Planctomycetes bacterium]|nr:hypothetical protein [Planctomycetota bacterium]
TSSGIVHPAPSGLETFVMRLLGGESEDEITAGVWAGLGRATAAQRYIEERNFLSLSFDQKPGLRLWAQWHTEGAALEPQVVLEA